MGISPTGVVTLLSIKLWGVNASDKPGADPGFLLGGGAPLRNNVTDQ